MEVRPSFEEAAREIQNAGSILANIKKGTDPALEASLRDAGNALIAAGRKLAQAATRGE